MKLQYWYKIKLETFKSVSKKSLLTDEEQQVTKERKEDQEQQKYGKESKPVTLNPSSKWGTTCIASYTSYTIIARTVSSDKIRVPHGYVKCDIKPCDEGKRKHIIIICQT